MQPAPSPVPSVPSASSIAPPIRVLLADDHASMREALSFLLEPLADIQVIGEADDGETALRQVEALTPDVVLMDINMPRMDGIEATRRIRKAHPDIHIVGLIVQGDALRAKVMKKAGATICIGKGGAPDRMIRIIRSLARPPCNAS